MTELDLAAVNADGTEVDPCKQPPEADKTKPAPEADKTKPAAPDGGYGWFVVLGCFLYNVVSGGIERSDGVFFLQFTARFGQSAQLTSWPSAIMATLNLCLGPIAGAISNRYSVRTTVMLGGLLMSVGCILDGFATNFYFLFFSHALLLGVGRGLSYAPSLIIVATYFDKRRGLATGIGQSGVGGGTFILVPLTQLLFDTYGFQGAFLILGGIALNTNLAAMMYRPLSMHNLFMQSTKTRTSNIGRVEATEIIVASKTIFETESLSSVCLDPVETQPTQEIHSSTCSTNKNTETDELKQLQQHPFLGSNIFASVMKICCPTEIRTDSDTTVGKLCHFNLLKNTSFLLFCVSIWLFAMAMRSGFVFIPPLVCSKGITESKASLVLSISGVADCVSRIGAGFLFDVSVLRLYRLLIYTVVSLVLACVVFLLPSMDSFVSFLILCCVFGFFTGIYISQRLMILVDILGIQHLANSLGILICFQSGGTLLGPPLSGAVKDLFGTYAGAFYLSGVLMVAAGVLMFASSLYLRIQRQTIR